MYIIVIHNLFRDTECSKKNFLLVLISVILSSGFLSSEAKIKKPDFSHERGFYNSPFDVTVNSELSSASIRYTLDGSDPGTSATAVTLLQPAVIRIDPESTDGQRARTPGVILRACVVSADSMSESVAHSYMFLNKIGSLSPENVRPGNKWPAPTFDGQFIDYGLEAAILNDPRYKDLIDDAFLAIPTISVSTELENLFSPSTGIYVNAMQDGIEWERPASLELVNPDGSDGFQINCGIRIRGGWSRHNENPKHAFRFFFREEYGNGKLKYPLFYLTSN